MMNPGDFRELQRVQNHCHVAVGRKPGRVPLIKCLAAEGYIRSVDLFDDVA